MESAAYGITGIFLVIWIILQIVALWKIFTKAGKPGWHSIIPLLNIYDEFAICWRGWIGLLFLLLGGVMTGIAQNMQGSGDGSMSIGTSIVGIIVMVIFVIWAWKLAKSFGKGILTFLGLIFLNPIAMLYLGFSSAQYIGKR